MNPATASSYVPLPLRANQGLACKLVAFSLTALICLSIVVPVITVSSALPWFKIEQLALPIVVAVYCWLLSAGIAAPIRWNGLMIVAPLFALCILISLATGWLLLGHRVLVSDFYELPKAFLPVVFFTFGVEANLSETALRRLLFWFSVALALVCLYAFAQWMDLGVSHVLTPYYSGGWHDEGALAHYRRVYSTMGNPNMLGQLVTWAFAAFLLAILFQIGNRVRNALVAVACLVTLVMTGSRYGFIDLGLAIVLILALTWKAGRNKRRLVLLLLFLLPVVALIGIAVASSNPATMDRLQTLSNPFTTDSLRTRTQALWLDALHDFSQSPFFGNGPAKAIYGEIITDSEYFDVLKKFGLIGFLAYLGYFIIPLRALWRALRSSFRASGYFETRAPAALWSIRLAFVMGVVALFMNIGMATFYNAALQGFLWMWLGIGVGSARRIAFAARE